MTRLEEIRTTDINLAAAIMTATNLKPAKIAKGSELVEFTFPANEKTKGVALKYAAGTLTQEVRRLMANRSWLYRQAREVTRSGREVRP